MIETRVVIVQVDGQHALVQANQGNGCELCNGKGCGAGKLSQLFCSKSRQFRVDNPINADIGDEVIVSVADGAVMRGIGLIYLLPMSLLIIGAMLGSVWAALPEQRDGYAALGALLGLMTGFAFARWVALRQTGNHFQPRITRLCRNSIQGKVLD